MIDDTKVFAERRAFQLNGHTILETEFNGVVIVWVDGKKKDMSFEDAIMFVSKLRNPLRDVELEYHAILNRAYAGEDIDLERMRELQMLIEWYRDLGLEV